MYEAYWGLNEPPFSLTPDPRFLYLSRGHEDALTMLTYAITRNKGAADEAHQHATARQHLTHHAQQRPLLPRVVHKHLPHHILPTPRLRALLSFLSLLSLLLPGTFALPVGAR